MAANVVLNITAQNNASGVLSKVSSELDKVGASVTKARTGLGSLGGGFEALTGAVFGAGAALTAITAGLAGLGVAGAALLKLASAAANYGEEVENAAARTGLATDSVQELMKVAKDAGIGFESIATSVNKMQVALLKTPNVFKSLGLDANSLAKQSPEKALEAVAGKINQIGNQAQKTATLVAIFGRGGAASMAPLLDSLEHGRKSAAELNAVLSKPQLAGLKQYDAAIDDLDTAWDGLLKQLGTAVANSPAIQEAIKGITFAIVKMSEWIEAHAGDISAFFDSILSGALSAAGGLVQIVQSLPGGQSLVEKAFGSKQAIGNYFKVIDDGIDKVTARAAARASGKDPLNLLGLNILGGSKGKGGPGGVDPSGDAAAKAAAKAQEAWQKAAEAARKEWDKFDADMEKRGKDIVDALFKSAGTGGGETTKQLGVRLFQQELDKMEDAAKDAAKAIEQAINSIEFEDAQTEEWEAAMKDVRMAAIDMEFRTVDAFFSMADAGQQFADEIGGTAGEFVSLASAGVGAYAQIADAINQAKARQEEFGTSVGTTADKINALANGIRSAIGILSGPGGLKGALSGALAGAGAGAGIGAAFGGPVGAGIGAGVGGIVGFIGGLFGKGKGKKEAAEVKQLQDQLLGLGGTMTGLQKLADKFGISLGNAFNTKKPNDVRKVIDQLTEAMEKQQKVLAGLSQASDALTGVFTKLKPTTEKGAAAQATIFSTVFWATVKERGFSEAIDALSAPFEALSKSLTEKFGPEVTNRLLGAVSVFFDPKIKESISVFSDIQRALEGVSEAGFITKDSFAAFGQTATDAFAQATAGGLNSQSALQAISPLLASIINTANQYGLTIDANTQALIDQAKAAGIAFPTSPIEKAAAAMERVAKALEKALGISNDLGDSLSNLPRGIPDFKGGGPGGRDDGFPRDFPAAKGFGPRVVGDEGGGLGPRFQTHAGELVMIVPKDQVRKGKKMIYARGGFGIDEGFDDRFDRDRPRPGDRPGGPGGSGTSGASGGTGTAGRPRPGGNVGASIPTVFIEQQRKNDKKFERVLALLEKEAAKPKQTNQIAVTQNVNAAFDPASVPATRQALTQQVLRDISAGVKQGAGELSRAIDSRIEMKRGRSRAGS